MNTCNFKSRSDYWSILSKTTRQTIFINLKLKSPFHLIILTLHSPQRTLMFINFILKFKNLRNIKELHDINNHIDNLAELIHQLFVGLKNSWIVFFEIFYLNPEISKWLIKSFDQLDLFHGHSFVGDVLVLFVVVDFFF